MRDKDRQSERGRDREGIIKKIYWLIDFLRKQTSVESHLSKLLAHTTCIVRSAVHFQKTKTKREKRQSQHVLLFFDRYVVSRVEKGKLLCNCEHKKELFSSL